MTHMQVRWEAKMPVNYRGLEIGSLLRRAHGQRVFRHSAVRLTQPELELLTKHRRTNPTGPLWAGDISPRRRSENIKLDGRFASINEPVFTYLRFPVSPT